MPFRRRAIAVFALLLALGVGLRVAPYVTNRSLWLDEALLALNLTHRDYRALAEPLDGGQASPLGFLVLERLVLDSWDGSERALRLIPLLASLASVGVFAALAGRMLQGPAVLIAVGLFSVSPPLAYYASEVKPYSSDVLVCVTLLVLADRVGGGITKATRLLALAVTGGVAVWVSHPAVFVCAGIGLTLVAAACRAGRRREVLLLLAVCSSWLISFVADYVLILRHADATGYLARFWARGFMPLPPHNAAELLWLPRSVMGVLADPAGLPYTGIAATAFVAGCVHLARLSPRRLALLVAPILWVLLASALRLHPFPSSGDPATQPLQGRVILFIVPSILILVAAGIGTLAASDRHTSRTAGRTMALLLLAPQVWDIPERLSHPIKVNEVRPLVEKLSRRLDPGDVVVVNTKGRPILRYYIDLLGEQWPELKTLQIVELMGKGDRAHIQRVILSLKPGRVFLLYAHHPSWRSLPDESFALERLNERGTEVFATQEAGASLYLYQVGARDALDPVTAPK